MEISRAKLEELAGKIGCPIAKKYYYTIQQMIELQKTLPATQEGFVVRFESGFRVKIKGEEYLKMSRILNSITPLNIWDLMGADEQMQVPGSYLVTIPERYRDEALDMVIQLKKNANKVMTEIRLDIETMWADGVDMSHFKTVGLWLQRKFWTIKTSHGNIYIYQRATECAVQIRKTCDSPYKQYSLERGIYAYQKITLSCLNSRSTGQLCQGHVPEEPAPCSV